MSENLFQLFTTQFSTNLELLLQQMGSKFRGKVTEGFHVGKMASPINQIGAIQLKAPAGRFAPKNRTDATLDRRWVFPQDGEIDQLIDSFDELKTIVDPKSFYAQNAGNAVGRAWDDAIILAAHGTAKLGVDAGSLTDETWASFSAAYEVADNFGTGGGSAVGLTVAKLIEAKRIFLKNHVDLDTDPVAVVIGSQQDSDLLKQVQVVSTDYNDKPVLVDGKVVRFMGFDIIHSERLSVYTTTTRGVIAYAKSGLYLGMWKETTNRVSIRNELSGEPYDLYTSASFGATRTQPGKVLRIDCYDTTGGDINP